jgi:hypothetical protein
VVRPLLPLSQLLLQLTQANAAGLGSLMSTTAEASSTTERTEGLQRVRPPCCCIQTPICASSRVGAGLARLQVVTAVRHGMDGAITTAKHCVDYLLKRSDAPHRTLIMRCCCV